MKKKIFMIAMLIGLQIYGQEKENKIADEYIKKNEINLNAFSLIAAKWLEVSYERILSEESSFGIAATLNTDKEYSTLDYAITPFYRYYFGAKYASGFFLEGFGSVFSAEESYDFFTNTRAYENGFALGVSVGGKFVTKKGVTAELLLGIGRNLAASNNSFNELYGRVGISAGYRF